MPQSRKRLPTIESGLETGKELDVFDRHVERVSSLRNSLPPSSSRPEPRGDSPSRVLASLRQHVHKLLRHQSRRLLDLFRKWDSDGDNTLSRGEFERAMSELGIVDAEDVAELWSELDVDSSGEIVYHELLEAIQPSLAAAKPSATALDPHNATRQFQYNRRDQEGASRLIERQTGIRDTPYSHRVAGSAANANFRESLRNDSVDSRAKEHAIGRLPGMTTRSVEDVSKVEQLQSALRASLYGSAMVRIIDVFRAWDVDEDGKISRSEFKAAVASLGHGQATDDELAAMFSKFDANGDGSIDYGELERALAKRGGEQRGAPTAKAKGMAKGGGAKAGMAHESASGAGGSRACNASPSGGDDGPNALVGRVKDKLTQKLGRVPDIFRALDKDRSNTISASEFRVALASLGFTGEAADEVWAVIDADGSGEIVYHELLAVLQPSRAAAHPSISAMDPNARGTFRYSKRDQEDASRLIERDSGVRDVPFEEAEAMRMAQRNPRFR